MRLKNKLYKEQAASRKRRLDGSQSDVGIEVEVEVNVRKICAEKRETDWVYK